MTGGLKRTAEKLVDGFRHMWAEHDHCTSNRQKLGNFLVELAKDNLICFRFGGQQGSYVVRLAVNGDIALLFDRGEVNFLNMDLARECRKILGDSYQVLQIIE